jgi:hypothetical protein
MEDKGFDHDFVSKTELPWLLCTYAIPSQYSENRSFTILFKKNFFVSVALFLPFNTQKMHFVILYTMSLTCFPKNLKPWRDLNPDLLVPEADAMSTALCRQCKTEVSH